MSTAEMTWTVGQRAVIDRRTVVTVGWRRRSDL